MIAESWAFGPEPGPPHVGMPTPAPAAPDASSTPTAALLIPGEGVGKVIGKAGSGLKQIRERTGAKLVVQQDPSGGGAASRRVDLIGLPANIARAVSVILHVVSGNHSAPAEAMMLIPNNRAGIVIGKGGEKLKRIRESTGVRIMVDRDPVSNSLTGEEERLLTIQGDPTSIGSAVAIALSGAGGVPGGAATFGGARECVVGGLGFGALAPCSLVVGGCPAVEKLGAAPVSQYEVHSMPEDMDFIQVHFSIPGKLTGAIVGKSGTNIQNLATQCNCHRLAMTKKMSESVQRRVICIGGFAQVQMAQQVIQNTVQSNCEAAGLDANALLEVTAIFWIPQEFCGGVIGKSGANLAAVREQAGVKLHLDKESVKGMRPCSLSGTLPNVLQAETLVYSAMMQERERLLPAKRSAGALNQMDDGAKRPRFKELALSEQTKLLVPSRYAGTVIGKQGSNLARIRQECGVRIEVMTQAQAPHWHEDRVVVLQGQASNRLSAATAVLRAAFPPELPQVGFKMLVSSSEAGAIIGRQGGMLKFIREQCAVDLTVQKEEIQGERLVSIAGHVPQLLAALQLVMEALCRIGDSGQPTADAQQLPADDGQHGLVYA